MSASRSLSSPSASYLFAVCADSKRGFASPGRRYLIHHVLCFWSSPPLAFVGRLIDTPEPLGAPLLALLLAAHFASLLDASQAGTSARRSAGIALTDRRPCRRMAPPLAVQVALRPRAHLPLGHVRKIFAACFGVSHSSASTGAATSRTIGARSFQSSSASARCRSAECQRHRSSPTRSSPGASGKLDHVEWRDILGLHLRPLRIGRPWLGALRFLKETFFAPIATNCVLMAATCSRLDGTITNVSDDAVLSVPRRKSGITTVKVLCSSGCIRLNARCSSRRFFVDAALPSADRYGRLAEPLG